MKFPAIPCVPCNSLRSLQLPCALCNCPALPAIALRSLQCPALPFVYHLCSDESKDSPSNHNSSAATPRAIWGTYQSYNFVTTKIEVPEIASIPELFFPFILPFFQLSFSISCSTCNYLNTQFFVQVIVRQM